MKEFLLACMWRSAYFTRSSFESLRTFWWRHFPICELSVHDMVKIFIIVLKAYCILEHPMGVC